MTVREIGKVTKVGKDDTSTIIKQVYPLPYGFIKHKTSKNKLSDKQVINIRKRHAEFKGKVNTEYFKRLAKKYGVHFQTIKDVINNISYKHIK
jgi:hypothetical protein